VAFDLKVEFYNKGKVRISTPLTFTATLDRRGSRWVMSNLKSRS
jgi:hypothetical protein